MDNKRMESLHRAGLLMCFLALQYKSCRRRLLTVGNSCPYHGRTPCCSYALKTVHSEDITRMQHNLNCGNIETESKAREIFAERSTLYNRTWNGEDRGSRIVAVIQMLHDLLLKDISIAAAHDLHVTALPSSFKLIILARSAQPPSDSHIDLLQMCIIGQPAMTAMPDQGENKHSVRFRP